MSFLEALKANRGGLLKVKTQLYWYDQGGWDNNPGRACLILDAAERRLGVDACTSERILTGRLDGAVAVFLLIDGSPHWVWVDQQDVELNFSLMDAN
jgi:hypothetical protein